MRICFIVMYTFNDLHTMFTDNFNKLSKLQEGVKYLKIRTLIEREPLKKSKELKQFLTQQQMPFSKINKDEINRIRNDLFEHEIDSDKLDEIIRKVYKEISMSDTESLKPSLSEIGQNMEQYRKGWDGIFGEDIRKHIQHHFVRNSSIMTLKKLLRKIKAELYSTIRDYTIISWYNQWTSTIIENIFKSHSRVVPTIRKIPNVDFFFLNTPIDLKTTPLPIGYIKEKKKDGKKLPNDIIKHIESNPLEVSKWLYENQGPRRFAADNRIFVVLVDENDLEHSWKMKSSFKLIEEKVKDYLDNAIELSKLTWTYNKDPEKNGTYTTYTAVIPIISK